MNPNELVFMVVDDDSMVRDILIQYLNEFGYKNVFSAKNGADALKMIRNPKFRLDVVISDWEMPKVNGLTLLRALRRDPARSNVKFLMVSSQASRERQKITQAIKSDVDAYIIKPFRSQLLKEKLDSLVSEISPVDAKLVIEFVNSYHRVGWIGKALSLCKVGMEKFPENHEIAFLTGKSLFLDSQLDEAIDVLEKLLKAKPGYMDAHKLLNNVREEKDKILKKVI